MAYPNEPPRKYTGQKNMGAGASFLLDAQLLYLNATAWLQPQVVRVVRGGGVPHNVDAVETVVNDQRVDFYSDRKTHLPVQIIAYDKERVRPGWEGNMVYKLSEYKDVGGIWIPHRVDTGSWNRWGTTRYQTQIDVVFRDDLFTAAPDLKDGPDGWKPR
jgi:hypothetical protein